MTSASKPEPPKWLLEKAVHDDSDEEDALDFLQDHRIPIASHSRIYLITLAYQHGWRPRP